MLIRPGRRLLIRCLLISFVSLSLALLFFFLKVLVPPYEFYKELFAAEKEDSFTLVKNHTHPGHFKFVKFRQLQGAGFNNQAQEILLFHHLALETSRKYVYQPLVWRPRGEKSIVPLSAFLPGVTHNSLSSAVFDEICPEEKVQHLRLHAAAWSEQWEYAVSKLREDTECIVVDDWIMNWKIQDKLDLQSETLGKGQPYLAIHLRRGDFKEHCKSLASKKKGFTTWATLPILQPSVYPPSVVPSNMSSVMEHCYPSIDRILSAVTLQAQRHPEARKLLILHDGTLDHPLVYVDLYKIRAAVTSEIWTNQQGWQNGPMKQISTTDGFLGWGEHDWGVCVDVELARRATAFIGNGFSSLSSQVAALRMADGGGEGDISFV